MLDDRQDMGEDGVEARAGGDQASPYEQPVVLSSFRVEHHPRVPALLDVWRRVVLWPVVDVVRGVPERVPGVLVLAGGQQGGVVEDGLDCVEIPA